MTVQTPSIADVLREARATRDFDPLIATIPYARFMGFRVDIEHADVLVTMPFGDHLMGNTTVDAIHGGTLGALMETAGIFKLLWAADTVQVPKTINITVEYLRKAERGKDTFARAEFIRQGRRVANVRTECWQDDRSRLVGRGQRAFPARAPTTDAPRESAFLSSRSAIGTRHGLHNHRSPPATSGPYGGRFVAETLMPALEELTKAYDEIRTDAAFQADLDALLARYVGRPTPIYRATRLGEEVGLEVWLKREDLCHTGAHKVNNTLGQVLLAKRMGKTRIIAETGAGQHGVATATACALFGLPCEVFMGAEGRSPAGAQRQANGSCSGRRCTPSPPGARRSKDAMNEALRDWVTNVRTTYYCVGSAAGPHPYPTLVRDFQAVIGREARQQMLDEAGGLPAAVVACVGGGQQRHRHLQRVHPRRGRPIDRGRGGRGGRRHGQARRHAHRRPRGCSARREELPAAGRRRPNRRSALDQRRPGLPWRRSGA